MNTLSDPPEDETRRRGGGDVISVLLPLPLSGTYDYRVPAGVTVADGDFVAVPLGGRETVGVVWGPGTGDVAEDKLRDVIGGLDCPSLPRVSRAFVEWVAKYALQPWGAVLKMTMSVPDALAPPRSVSAYALNPVPDEFRRTPARERVLAVLADGPPRTGAELARQAAVSPGVVKGLADAGILERVELPGTIDMPRPDAERPGPILSGDQAQAAAHLVDAVSSGFSTTLVDGVTGSGKTEVYFEAIAAALKSGKQALVLLPEIALSAQWLQRFEARFGAAPAVWHSDLTQATRRHTWRAVAEGRATVVVGARSALFLPFPRLGLVVVDEEHDTAYKQEDGVIYNARDMAVVRARLGELPAVLVSATPSLETVVNAEQNRYQSVHLPDRHGGAALPDIRLVDMRAEPPDRGSWLSPALVQRLAETLTAGEQAILFLNRRGYAPLTLCRKCGHRFQCPSCTSWLVEHRLAGRLQCHHCGYSLGLPELCPACETDDTLVACGPGVERLMEEARSRFPDARVALATSDTLTTARAAADMVSRIEDHEVDLIIGTQIVAKGHHFPLLTTVGVIDADLGLTGGDLRAAERTYQLLSQVAGRAGRAERPGTVLLQTYMPDHPVMAALASGEREPFVTAETTARRDAAMPPFGRLVALIVSGRDEAAVDQAAQNLARSAPHDDGVRVLGPAPAPLALLRGRHRRRLLLKASKDTNVQSAVRQWLSRTRWPKKVRVQVDVDPYGFF